MANKVTLFEELSMAQICKWWQFYGQFLKPLTLCKCFVSKDTPIQKRTQRNKSWEIR